MFKKLNKISAKNMINTSKKPLVVLLYSNFSKGSYDSVTILKNYYNKHNNFNVGTILVKSPDDKILDKFNAYSFPTLILFKHGREYARSVGLFNEDLLDTFIR